jgi:hypothetical protein
MEGNWVATLVLLSWPLVTMILFRILSPAVAALWTVMGGQLILPVGMAFKFAMIPQFDKMSIPNVCALLGWLFSARSQTQQSRGFGLVEALMAGYIVAPIVTSLQNGDPIVMEYLVLPGVGVYDGISASISAAIALIPFFIGRRLLRSSEDIQNVIAVLVIGQLIYSLALLFEIRFSPQLHAWIYGYYPTDFLQEVREGGFRPMVFMGHGLLAAFFLMTATVGVAGLWRAHIRLTPIPNAALFAYLAMVLVFCKSLGALLYGTFLAPIVAFARPKLQVRIAAFIVSIALLYPMLRSFDLFPTNTVLNLANSISPDRAQSLQTRFVNEEALLERASQKLWFGWGRFGRNRIYDAYGKDVTLTDGQWIITAGQFGIVGFLLQFGLLTLGVYRAVSVIRSSEYTRSAILLSSLSLIVAVNILDLLPNSGLEPWTWILAGGLLGRCESLKSRERKKESFPAPASRLLVKSGVKGGFR